MPVKPAAKKPAAVPAKKPAAVPAKQESEEDEDEDDDEEDDEEEDGIRCLLLNTFWDLGEGGYLKDNGIDAVCAQLVLADCCCPCC